MRTLTYAVNRIAHARRDNVPVLWIIRRTDQGGGYLAQPHSSRTYTARRDKAQRFNSCEAAARHCCENETAEVL